MNFDYFIENGYFKAKRLPPTKGTVKIKDCTDLYLLRDYLEDTKNIGESIEAYNHCFNEPDMYDVEVETFEEYFNRNPNKFLNGLDKLKGNFVLIEELRGFDVKKREYEWLSVDDGIGKLLEKYNLAEVNKNIAEKDWIKYLKSKYNIQDMKLLGIKNSIILKGNKSEMAKILYDSIQSGLINHEKPFLIRPGNNLEKWLEELQITYVSEIEYGLSLFDYPDNYLAAVWDMVFIDNSDNEAIIRQVKERHGKYIRKEDFYSEKDTNNKVDNEGYKLTFSLSYSDPKEDEPHKIINLVGTDVKFDYRNKNNIKSTRIVNINAVWDDDGILYFQGHCNMRNEIRTFRISGVVSNMINIASGEILNPSNIHDVNDFRDFIESKAD